MLHSFVFLWVHEELFALLLKNIMKKIYLTTCSSDVHSGVSRKKVPPQDKAEIRDGPAQGFSDRRPNTKEQT